MNDRIDIGLTFYGGVSLAVFEAGVAYELIRALQFSRTHAIPDLHIDVISGTSAGGLTAIQIAAALGGKDVDGVLAQMLSMWANVADITRLLPRGGYTGQGLLDKDVLIKGVRRFLETAAAGSSDALETDMEFILTVTNFSGLREPVMLPQGVDAFRSSELFPTKRHYEYERFGVEDVLEPSKHEAVALAGASTAGFPIAFTPTVKPSRSLPDAVEQTFVYVDGGLRDNRPLGVALDAIQQRPSPRRVYFFIDPNETFVPLETGRGASGALETDPCSILGSLLTVARADSVFEDINRLRATNDRQSLLKALSRHVYREKTMRDALLGLHREVVVQKFNADVAALILLLGEQTTPAIDTLWNEIKTIHRFVIRERASEYLRLLELEGALGAEERSELEALLNRPGRWTVYYTLVRTIKAHSKGLRNLRYAVWNAAYRATDGMQVASTIPPPILEDIRAELEKLLADVRSLEAIRTKLAEDFFAEANIPAGQMSDFLDYARAMQVLESLAGLKGKGEIKVGRITPFDLYKASPKRRDQTPLAGGSLAAFGGFLEKRWRINDFLVGRLAMRRRLLSEGLIPEEYFDDYLAETAVADRNVLGALAAGSEERAQLKKLIELSRQDQGPYDDDAQKPVGVLLQLGDMGINAVEPKRLIHIMRRVSGSVRRILGMNGRLQPYTVMGALKPVLRVAESVAWVVERTVLVKTTKSVSSYFKMLLIGLAIGFAVGVWVAL